jgi:hypothetical protein
VTCHPTRVQLPQLSVDNVYTSGEIGERVPTREPYPYTNADTEPDVQQPQLRVVTESDAEVYTLYNSSSGWPLAKDSSLTSSPDQLLDWLTNLEYMMFHFVVKSLGTFLERNSVCILVSCMLSHLLLLKLSYSVECTV